MASTQEISCLLICCLFKQLLNTLLITYPVGMLMKHWWLNNMNFLFQAPIISLQRLPQHLKDNADQLGSIHFCWLLIRSRPRASHLNSLNFGFPQLQKWGKLSKRCWKVDWNNIRKQLGTVITWLTFVKPSCKLLFTVWWKPHLHHIYYSYFIWKEMEV